MHVCMLHILIWCWAAFLAVHVFLRICGESFVLLIPVLICALWEGHWLLLLRDPYKCLTCFYMFFFTSLAKTLWIMVYDANIPQLSIFLFCPTDQSTHWRTWSSWGRRYDDSRPSPCPCLLETLQWIQWFASRSWFFSFLQCLHSCW